MITGPLTWRSLRACKTLYPTRSWRRRRSRRVVVVSRPALNARAGIRGLLLTTLSPHSPALPRHGPEARVRHLSEHREPLLVFTLGPRRILDRPVQLLLRTGEDRARLVGVVVGGYDVLERVTQLAFQRLRLLAEDVRPEFRHDGDRLRLPRVAAAHALYASKRSSARCLNNPSAICERAQFWVHRDRTLVLATFLGLALECPANQPVFIDVCTKFNVALGRNFALRRR